MTTEPTSLALVGDTDVVITRLFHAPPQIVFQAYTRPEYVRRWWAPVSRGVRVLECEVDLRVGGGYRYVLEHPRGRIAFLGTYLEIVPPTRLVYTERYCPDAVTPLPDAGHLTVSFEERDGLTFFTARVHYPSKDVRDQVLASGMEDGMRETYALLDELVAAEAR